MWGGRFDKEPDLGFMQFSSSIRFDVRLYPYDIACSAAWASALHGAGVLSVEERELIREALVRIRGELERGDFTFLETDEDIHTAVERRLVEITGPSGGKVRTGRSRNDQVATDMRLFVMDECARLSNCLRGLQRALAEKAESGIDIIVPGHTHLQQAQPVLLAHALLAFVHMLQRDITTFAAASSMADCLPLGSGALAGTGIAVDREALAVELGFSSVTRNSLDAVSDRDFVCAALFACSMTMVHLSRLAEQVILWCSSEFGMATLDDSWATGSSLMPQKKNPDGPELVRGKTGRVQGDLMGMLTVLKGLPLAYNRDLQEDKEGLFDALDTTSSCLKVMKGTVSTISFDAERAAVLSAGGFMTATDLAEYLTGRGLPFPDAHRVVGEVVACCAERGVELSALTAEEIGVFSEGLGAEALEVLSPAASVERRSATGGTAPEEVRRQLVMVKAMIEGGAGAL